MPEQGTPADWSVNEQTLGLEQLMWRRRIVLLASWIDACDKSVMDLGAGHMHLARLLRPGVRYIPVDYKKRFEETVVCDFNQHEFPDAHVDVICCAGIIGYMKEPFWFLEQCMAHARKVLISNCGREILAPERICAFFAAHGWALTHTSNAYPMWSLLGCFERVTPAHFGHLTECAGCGACAAACPSGALTLGTNADGFLMPAFHEDHCVQCGACLRACPLLSDHISAATPDDHRLEYEVACYAAWAPDDLRQRSSSGGAFGVLAEQMLAMGGHVFGVVWTKGFTCSIVELDRTTIERAHFSKYVQSRTGTSFRRVKAYLVQHERVLYVGTPCQIAGLRAYLGPLWDTPELVAADLLCAGMPSAKWWQMYLAETYGGRTVQDVAFRVKDRLGWSPFGLRVETGEGTLFPDASTDDYERAFHGFLLRSDVCAHCRYADFPRQGDITLGDFWGIEQHRPDWNDGKGTSLFLVNSVRGERMQARVRERFARMERLPLAYARGKGNCIGADAHPPAPFHTRFRTLVRQMSFHEAVEQTLSQRYDIGLVVMANGNYGNHLVNYALYRTLKALGRSVLVISSPSDVPMNGALTPCAQWFLRPVYDPDDLAGSIQEKELRQLNERCRMFLTGGDQLFRETFLVGMNDFPLLAWADDAHFKGAFGTSFGTDRYEGDFLRRAEVCAYLARFQEIAVREASGARILAETFGRQGALVSDPVFLLDRAAYDAMSDIGGMRTPQEAYVGAYLLDPNKTKTRIVQQAVNRFSDGRSLCVSDGSIPADELEQAGLPQLSQAGAEELLSLIRSSTFFVTDSFHGLCFALLFHRPFVVIFEEDNWRGRTRIAELLANVGLSSRLVTNIDAAKAQMEMSVDWNAVDAWIARTRTDGITILKRMVMRGMAYRGSFSAYDLAMRKLASLSEAWEAETMQREHLRVQCEQLQAQQVQMREEQNYVRYLQRVLGSKMFLASHTAVPCDNEAAQMKGCGNVQVVAFGAGDCFQRNLACIRDVYDLRYVVDNAPEKWGQTFDRGVMCISPKKLAEMQDVLVIITVDAPGRAFAIARQLLAMGIMNFDHVENWLAAIAGER